MSSPEFELTEPELSAEDVLVLDDSRFVPESVAVVTGAASGIGRATTVALAANDLTVVGADIDEEGLYGTVDLAADVGASGDVVPIPTDLTDDEQVETMVDAATSGTSRTSPASSTSPPSRRSRWRSTTSCWTSCSGRRS